MGEIKFVTINSSFCVVSLEYENGTVVDHRDMDIEQYEAAEAFVREAFSGSAPAA